jgi:class 3 adenylate cyclase
MQASFGAGQMPTRFDEAALDRLLAELEAARSWSPRMVSRLEALIHAEDDAELFRVNPLTFAAERGFNETETVDLFLHASAVGLFSMDWLLICPRCACAVESFARLRAVLRRFRCPECLNEYETAMDDYIAVYFTVSPQIRSLRYHRPEELEPYEYIYIYKGVREGVRPDGVRFLDGVRSYLRCASHLPPGGTVTLTTAAAPGALMAFSADVEAGFALKVSGEERREPQRVRLTYSPQGYQPAELEIAPGPVEIEIANPTTERGIVAVLQTGPEDEEVMLDFDPYLTGKHLLTSQTFRTLFRSEVIGGARGLAIRDVALLFTDIKGSTVLYERIGDLNAYELVQQHFDRLRDVTLKHGGAIVKTIGDAVMAAYPDAGRAVAAALEMRAALQDFNEGQAERSVSLKIGVHHGAAIAVTLNDQLDYFGHTVNIASRVQELAGADEVLITDDVWQFPGVHDQLGTFETERRTAALVGIEQPIGLVRIGAARS